MKNKVIKVFLFVAGFIVLNQIFGFALGQGIGFSDAMWDEFYETEDLDTLYIGASIAQCAFNPMLIDEIRGTNSFNMATPDQSLESTYLAVETAMKEHDIKQVVLGFGYFVLSNGEGVQSDVAFRKAMISNQPFLQKIGSTADFIFDKEYIGENVSLNFFSPWVYNHVDLDANKIAHNVQNKWKVLQMGEEFRPGDYKITYVGRGYAEYLTTMDYNQIGDINTKSYYQPDIYSPSVGKLKDLCRLCEENGIQLIVINTPRPTFDLTSYGEEYYVLYSWAKQFFAENGAQYYDFNLAKPEVFESKPEYFFNFEHLNYMGAEAFSKGVAVFLERLEQGENVESDFYNWQEYIESLDTI